MVSAGGTCTLCRWEPQALTYLRRAESSGLDAHCPSRANMEALSCKGRVVREVDSHFLAKAGLSDDTRLYVKLVKYRAQDSEPKP